MPCTIGGHAAHLPLICSPDPRDPPLLDVCLHKALTCLLEVRTHFDPPLWAHVDPDADRTDLEAWDEVSVDPSIVWLSGDAPDGDYWQRY